MKHSRYTYELTYSPTPDHQELLLYNTATGALAALSEDAASLWHGLAEDGGDSSVAAEGQSAWLKTLEDQGFLVDDGLDEQALQSQRFRAAQQDRSTLHLCLAPTYACNLRCPYCYEKDHTDTWKKMDAQVQADVIEFVQKLYDRDHFKTLNIQWYGGDPSLALDVVEHISSELISWCDQHGVTYEATMLSNCVNITDDAAALLARSRVKEVMVTVDGDHDLHNVRRPTADGTDSFDALMNGIRALTDFGIRVFTVMNIDKINAQVYEEMRDELADRFGIVLLPTKLNDYHNGFGCGSFAAPNFDLFTFPEYARWDLALQQTQCNKADQLDTRLEPCDFFCRGQLENYYCIDALGDVYKCDGRMGQPEYVMFNISDGSPLNVSELNTATDNPTLDPLCGDCLILPLCRGNCYWERECCGMPCHPLKYTLDDYLSLYRQLSQSPTEDVAILKSAQGREIRE